MRKKKLTARILPLLLTVVMFAGLLSTTVSAKDEETNVAAQNDLATYENMIISNGFNADVVATSTVSTSAEHYSQTDAMDHSGKADQRACFFSSGVGEKTGYLPDNRTVTSKDTTTPGLNWKLADYTESNVLKVSPENPVGTLTFSQPGCYQNVYILCTAGGIGTGYSATMNTVVTYTDGTKDNSSFEVWDWYDDENVATDIYQRLDGGELDGYTDGAPYMTQCIMSVDTTKLIQAVQITSETSGMYVCVFGVTGKTATVQAPATAAATNITNNSFTANWEGVSGALGYVLDVSTSSDFSTILTGYNNKDVGDNTSFSVTGLDANTNYYYRVRTKAADGISASSEQRAVTTESAAHTHTLTKVDAKAAAETEPGNIEYWTCGCGKYFSDAEGKSEISQNDTVIPATGHTLTKVDAKAATETADGNIEYWTCECGKYFSDADGMNEITLAQTVIPATGHSQTLPKVDAKAATANTPKTGDDSNVIWWITLLVLSGGTTLILVKRRKRVGK